MLRRNSRTQTTKPSLKLHPERPEDEALVLRIFVASEALEFDSIPMPLFQKAGWMAPAGVVTVRLRTRRWQAS
jgi:hypothetical protein